MRLFIAVSFNDDTVNGLLALRDALRSRSERGRFSPIENLHLTLAFLGECDAKQVADAKTVMAEIVFDPFGIEIERVGRFKRDFGDLWWAGVRISEPLSALHDDLVQKLVNVGFNLENRKFNPHITLGREIVTDAEPWIVRAFGETVSSIELMKSERISGKMVYTAIASTKP